MLSSYESFTDKEKLALQQFVTNTDQSIFVLKNLPEVIKGALFSRYSRSALGLRSLLLKEFILNSDESGFSSMVSEEENAQGQTLAIQKAQSFYDRILDGYGDDSIGELGGAHLALENISMLAAKAIEDCRIGGSPLEKSTRYIPFDQKVDGRYLYFREPTLMTSAFREKYVEACDHLFKTYSQLIGPLTEKIKKEFVPTENMSPGAYQAALRAKVLDCLRGLLPASTMTNMGVFGNGRFFDGLIHKLHCNPLQELQEIGALSFDELSKVIPSFIRRADPSHHTHQGLSDFYDAMQKDLKDAADRFIKSTPQRSKTGASLISYDPASVLEVATALIYPHSDRSLAEIKEDVKRLNPLEVVTILEAASRSRQNRRHKSPRALEHAMFTFEIVADFGVYRDLHRHRMLTQERQLLSCDLGYYIPNEILGTEMEQPYKEAMEKAKGVFDIIRESLPFEAQYVVPMGYNVRFYFAVNLRALQWLTELRSQPAGHTSYRLIAQQMAKEVIAAVPQFECFFEFVDFGGYELGRLGQEERRVNKQAITK